jgi:hypothetical protein
MTLSAASRRSLTITLTLAIGLLPAACDEGKTGSGDSGTEASVTVTETDPACTPGNVAGNPMVEPDRRIEDIIFHLTRESQTGDPDPVQQTIDNPNFGGVWGDSSDGIVVAVLDCSTVNADEIARLAGGSEYLHLIEVSHTFQQVTEFRDELIRELNAIGVQAEVMIDSTMTGRHITVQIPDPGDLPDGFGSAVPGHLFSIAEGDLFGEG